MCAMMQKLRIVERSGMNTEVRQYVQRTVGVAA
jgi:hypothetical protein